MAIVNSEPPLHYIERVRIRSVYPQARRIINIVFWLSVIAVLLVSVSTAVAAFAAAIRSESLLALLPAIGLLMGVVIYLCVLVLLKAVAIAYFDAVDVLVESNRRKKDESGQTAS
jgi:hypothetical protein